MYQRSRYKRTFFLEKNVFKHASLFGQKTKTVATKCSFFYFYFFLEPRNYFWIEKNVPWKKYFIFYDGLVAIMPRHPQLKNKALCQDYFSSNLCEVSARISNSKKQSLARKIIIQKCCKSLVCMHGEGGHIAKCIAYLLTDSAALGLIPSIPPKNSQEKLSMVLMLINGAAQR